MKKPTKKPALIIAIGVKKKPKSDGPAKGNVGAAPSGSDYSQGSFGKGKLQDKGRKK